MTPFEIQKAKIDATYGVVNNDILKSGEGSKGGKVIGHTKSGKAIYDTHSHLSHNNFNSDDHIDASCLHNESVSTILKKREKVKNQDKRDQMMNDSVTAYKNEKAHHQKFLKLREAEENSSEIEEDEDDEEVYQRKQKEKRDKENEGKFMYDDILKLKSPHVNFTTDVSFRGYNGDKAVVWDKKNGSQFTVPKEWLKR